MFEQYVTWLYREAQLPWKVQNMTEGERRSLYHIIYYIKWGLIRLKSLNSATKYGTINFCKTKRRILVRLFVNLMTGLINYSVINVNKPGEGYTSKYVIFRRKIDFDRVELKWYNFWGSGNSFDIFITECQTWRVKLIDIFE